MQSGRHRAEHHDRLRRDEEVTLSVLNRICVALDVNIGDMMEFVPEEK
jgi:DNA-binding Xre family transcriptional regulator